jgi:quercetin dioxygenase-like cupin family protein
MPVEHWNSTTDGPLSEETLRRRVEARGYRVSRFVYPSGTSFPPHTHAVDKIDAVLFGRSRLILAGATLVLEAGDLVAVPRGALHDAAVVDGGVRGESRRDTRRLTRDCR